MKVALCVIGRRENLYAEEFVSHHLSVGFDKIIVYDNNREGEERLIDVLGEYVARGEVDIVPLPNDGFVMLETYKKCYEEYGKHYDWLMMLDFDEFLYLKSGDIHTFLKGKDADCVSISWECYGDNDLVTYEAKPLKERFTTPLVGTDGTVEGYGENIHVKSIVRCGLSNITWKDPHCPFGCRSYIHADGSRRKGGPFQKQPSYGAAKIKHYMTKTIEEFMTNKVSRGQFDSKENSDKLKNEAVSLFFGRNKRTDEKEAWLKEHGYLS